MPRKTKSTLAFMAIVVLFMQTLFGSLPAMAIEHSFGQPNHAGKTATSPVTEQMTATSPDSATIIQPLQMTQATTADSAIIYVRKGATGTNTGTSWDDAFEDLQSALDEAPNQLNAGATSVQIWLAAGTYTPTTEVGGTGNRYKTFQMQNHVGIYGGFNGTESHLEARDWVTNKTILSGDIGIVGDNTDNAYHVFYHPEGLNLDTTAILDGVTITGGNANDSSPHSSGGGMYNASSSPTLTNVTFEGNRAVRGVSGAGGGMANWNSSSPTLTDVTFEGNTADTGGGMYNNYSSSPTLTDVTFEGNTATTNGGGMANRFTSSLTLTDVLFEGNAADNGGGMYNYYGNSLTLMDVTFEGNTADNGGGMFNDSSSPTLTNVTMSGNKSTSNAKGAIYGGTPNIRNSIIAGNNGEPALFQTNSGTTIENSLLDVEEGGQVLAKFHQSKNDIQPDTYPPEAIFIDPSKGNYQLRAGSPAINTGNNAQNTKLTDLAGNPRIQGDTIDLGAYESEFAYHMVYDANGATGEEPIDKMTYKQGDTITIQNRGSLARSGYTFAGWNTQADGRGQDYAEQAIFTMGTQHQTFYAKWAINTYSVTFDSNGGSAVAAQQVTYHTQASEPPAPRKQGHTFAGWYKDTDFTQEWDFAMDVVTEAMTLYAKWTANPTYSVTYDKNGATSGTVPQDSQAYEENARVTVQGNSGQLVRTGYTFNGWNTQADGTGTAYTENAIFPMGQTHVTLYAQWTANPPTTGGGSYTPPVTTDKEDLPPTTVTITLHTNGGTALTPFDIPFNTKISDLPSPTRTGYRFDGWYQDEALTKRWAADTLVRENISLYAKWTALPVVEPESPQPPKPVVTFGDIESHWAQERIEELAAQGIIQGYEDGSFRPNAPIRRMHVAVLLTRAFSLEPVRPRAHFSDVPSTNPYYEAIATLQQAGIVDGANGAFLPAENMTRAQLAKVLVGVLGLTPEGTSSFADVDSTHWSAGYIAVLEREGIALGDEGNFHPNAPVTRAQFVAFLSRIMQKL